jgi:hypothetical protein
MNPGILVFVLLAFGSAGCVAREVGPSQDVQSVVVRSEDAARRSERAATEAEGAEKRAREAQQRLDMLMRYPRWWRPCPTHDCL